MLVYVPLGRRYRASVTASVLKTIRCSACQTEFAYELERTGYGVETDWLWADPEGAEAFAVIDAEKKLE